MTPSCLVRRPWLEALQVPARGLARHRPGPLRPAARHHRRRQDLRRLARRVDGISGCSARGTRAGTKSDSTTAHRAVDHADARTGRRHAARIAAAAGSDGAHVERRRPQRRHRRRPSAARRTSGCPRCSSPRPKACRCCWRAPTPARCSAACRMVVVDEWHELLGNKRGVQVQLALARLRRWNAGLIVWGMSATLGNLEEAMHALLGAHEGVLVQGEVPKQLVVDSLLPGRAERFPWGGHLGPGHAAAGDRGDRRQQHHAGLHQHALAVRDLVSGDARGAARLGRRDRAAPRLARPRGARMGRGRASRTASCVPWSAPRAWTSASISCRSSACCRSARPRAWRGCCSAPAAPATRRGGLRASRWCPPTASRSSKAPRRARRSRPATSRRGTRPSSRSTCWCSTS